MADAPVAVNSIVLRRLARQTVVMRLPIRLLIPLLCLASCAPVPLYYKEGGSVSRQQSDLLSCEVDALAKAPVASQIRQSPPQFVPSRRYCSASGHCYYRGGYFVPGNVYTVDVNARLRGDLETQCMSVKGYQAIELPRCAAQTVPAPTAAGRTSDALPALSERSCAKRDDTGGWEIIDPAE